jgi:hypothetical protein
VSVDSNSLLDALDQRTEAQLVDSSFDATWASLTRLQRLICARIVDGAAISSAEARKLYAKGMVQRDVSPGSINDALRSLLDKRILSRVPGQRGAYRFDDVVFREWVSRLQRSSLTTK